MTPKRLPPNLQQLKSLQIRGTFILLIILPHIMKVAFAHILFDLMDFFLKEHVTTGAPCTFLSGFRLPWPPSCCLDELTPFVVSDEREFRHLNLTFGSSRIASSAYQKWPTRNSQSPSSPIKRQLVLTYLKFENRLRLLQPQGL